MNLRGMVNIAEASLTSGTTYNLLCCAAPSNQRIAIIGYKFFGKYNAAATPGLLQFCKAASQGSSGTTVTPLPKEPECTETFQSSWIATPSTPPSTIVAMTTEEVNPQLGVSDYVPLGEEIYVKGGGFFVLQFTPQVTTTYGGWLSINE